MKKLLVAFALALTCSAFADARLGTVDLLLLVRNHPNYESNKTLLTSTEKDLQKKLDALRADVEKIQDEGKKLSDQVRSPMLAEAARKQLEDELLEVQNRFLAGQQQLRNEAMRGQQDLQELEARLLKTTTDDLRQRLAKFAEKRKYDFIFDSNAAVYAQGGYDLTDDMLRELGADPAEARKRDESK